MVYEGDFGAKVIDLDELKSTLNEKSREENDETETIRESLKSACFKRLPEKQVLQCQSDINI